MSLPLHIFPRELTHLTFLANLDFVPAPTFSSRILGVCQCHLCQLPLSHGTFTEFHIRLVLAKMSQLGIFLRPYLQMCQLSIFLTANLGVPGEWVCQQTG